MRRIGIVLLFIFFVLCGCVKDEDISGMQSVDRDNNHLTHYYRLNALHAYKEADTYLFIIEDSDAIQKMVRFSAERACKQIQGLRLVDNVEFVDYLGIPFSEVEDALGQVHVDIGSGFYIPAYITKDAHLIYFQIENEKVCDVTVLDLLNNSIVCTYGT